VTISHPQTDWRESKMSRHFKVLSVFLTALPLVACGSDPPRPTQVVVQTPPAAPLIVPAPPPAQGELVPPPPQGAGTVAWQPGHWNYAGTADNPWIWEQGHYVPVPLGRTVWVPGYWAQLAGGGWTWVQGHWT